MADQQAADRLYSEATAKLNAKGGGFFGFGASKTDRYEEAADKFRDAGNMYRQVRDMQNSGKAFERAAEVHERYLGDPLESAKLLQDAFKSYKEASPADAVRCLQRSCQLYTAKGNFRRAADLMSELAAVYETKLEDNSKALECLETAITWYTDEGIPATANKARQTAGKLAALEGDYYKAVGIFVTGAEASLAGAPTGRFNVKSYLFKAGICQLATGDLVGIKKAIQEWTQLDRTFDQEREGRFLADLIDSMDQQQPERFAQLCATWDNMSKMEDWQVTVLLAAKKHVEAKDTEDGDYFA